MDKKNIEAIYPLSPLQKGILFDSLYAPDTLSYFVQIHFNLKNINLDWFKQAWLTVQQRHPVLRTLFVWEDQKQPLQVVLKQVELNWHVMDWQADKEQSEKLSKFLEEDKKIGFKLNKAPLMRFNIIQLDAEKIHFIWSHHHIILDGWSFPIILQEVLTIYQILSQNQTPSLPVSPPFKGYIQWIQKRDIERAKAYWIKALGGVVAPTPLMINQKTNKLAFYKEQHFDFKNNIKDKLQIFSREQRITLNTLAQASWALLLSAYSRHQDIVFGGMVSGRPAELQKVEIMVGLFANTIPVRVKINYQQIIKNWLQQLQSEQVEREEYSYQSLADIQQWCQISHLFDSVVVTENFPLDASLTNKQQALCIENFQFSEHANTPLILIFSLHQNNLSIRIIYDENQFITNDIQRLFEHLSLILTYLLENKDKTVNIPILLTETEQQQLTNWNNTHKNYPHACLHQFIEYQVQKTPDSIAAIYENNHLTYRQLNAKANQLAHYLHDLGIQIEDFVGIYIERSLEMIIGLLGILKAGAAYVPLDPSYPTERIEFMLQDAAPPVLLTQQRLLDSLPICQTQIICLDSDWYKITQKSNKNLNLMIELDQLAYMIYTSGSTGKPKGAMNSHLAISNRLLWMQDAYQLTEKDNILQKTPFSFDVSVWEFFWPLLAGAKLIFAKPEGHKDAAYLAQLIQQNQITILHFVPSMLQLFLQIENLEQCSTLRQVFCSGEALPVDLQNTFFNVFPYVALHNLYGPTEAAVDVTYWQCKPNEIRHIVPIGKPISNIQIHILNNNLQTTPIGIAGELHIAGIGVARGYHNRPELTAEKFIINPFAQGKLYKTGDLARWLPEGEIEYLGRIDHQVKIRGFRIELGEIEAVITQHPQINECVVLVQEGCEIEDKQLVAFVVPAAEHDTNHETAYIKQVSEIYHHTYGETNEITDFNIAGWNSSYTAKAIPDAEMQEWVKFTVQRILALKPQYIVEIGCGTGLLLSRIAPYCKAYLGLDLSAAAIAHVSQLQKSHPELNNVTLHQAAADDFNVIAGNNYDTLVINSVVQHFPSIQYFVNVLAQAIEMIEDGGKIFIGDIRNFKLLKTYHASVQLYQADCDTRLIALSERIEKQLAQEEELVIDPHFFAALQVQYPRIQHVEIYLKRGEFFNELTKFRFDVILHIGQKPECCTVEWQDWQVQWSLIAISEHLIQNQPKNFGLRNISNLRLVEENILLQQLQQDKTIATFKAELDKTVGLNPEALYQLAEKLHYQIELSWLSTDEQGRFSAVFKRADVEGLVDFAKPIVQSDYRIYANAPLQQSGIYQQNLITSLKQTLKKQLPDYMNPVHYVILEHIPLMPNGKIDRKALLAMDVHAKRHHVTLQSARDEIEKQLIEMWQEILNIKPIGIKDNFFELGGHSLMAIRLVSKIQQQFNLNLPLATLFEAVTIAGLADVIRKRVLDWRTVVKIQPDGHKPILYCVPGAGGNVLYYYELADVLGRERPFYGLQSKGLNGTDMPLLTVEAIAAHHIKHIKKVQPTGAYYLCGHSFGAYVAFEIARQLEQQGDIVQLLAILDLDATFYGGRAHPCHHWDEMEWMLEYAQAAKRMTGKEIIVKKADLINLDSVGRYIYFKQQLEVVDVLPPNTAMQQFTAYINVFKANTLAMMQYHQPTVQLNTQIALFKTKMGIQNDENIEILQQPAWGWQQFSKHAVSVYDVPGDHISMITPPHVTVLAEKLNCALNLV